MQPRVLDRILLTLLKRMKPEDPVEFMCKFLPLGPKAWAFYNDTVRVVIIVEIVMIRST